MTVSSDSVRLLAGAAEASVKKFRGAHRGRCREIRGSRQRLLTQELRILVTGKLHPDGLAVLNRPDVQLDYVEEVSAVSYQPCQNLRGRHSHQDTTASGRLYCCRPGCRSYRVTAWLRRGRCWRAQQAEYSGDRRRRCLNSRAVAEHAAMLMLAAARRTVLFDQRMRAGDWNYRNSLDCDELDGKNTFGRRLRQD